MDNNTDKDIFRQDCLYLNLVSTLRHPDFDNVEIVDLVLNRDYYFSNIVTSVSIYYKIKE